MPIIFIEALTLVKLVARLIMIVVAVMVMVGVVVVLVWLLALAVTTAIAAVVSAAGRRRVTIVAHERRSIVITILIISCVRLMPPLIVKTDILSEPVPHILVLLVAAWDSLLHTFVGVMVTSAVAALQAPPTIS